MNLMFKLFNQEIKINIRKYAPRIRCAGVYSICEDGQHIVMIDYDQLPLHHIISEIQSLQGSYDLSNFYIFETSPKSYFAVCMDKVYIHVLENIYKHTNCDPNYRRGYRYNSMASFVMRMTAKNKYKPTLIKVISRKSDRVKSKAHIKLFNYHYNLDIPQDLTDDQDKITLCKYTTTAK